MPISEKDLFDARTAWGNRLIEISKIFETEGIEMATSVASDMIDNLYGFKFGKVLFKPTLSGGSQTFRPTKEGALSYFVGHNSAYPNDSGFGIKFWREINSDTSAIFIDDTVAMWMGWLGRVGAFRCRRGGGRHACSTSVMLESSTPWWRSVRSFVAGS